MKSGLVMLEGNKGTFKTTIATQLSVHFNARVFKGIPKGEESLLRNYSNLYNAQIFLQTFWENLIEIASTELIIVDRTYITTIAFQDVFSDENRVFVHINDKQRFSLESRISQIFYSLIYLHDTSENIWARYTSRGTHEIKKTDFIRSIEEITTLNKRYDSFIRNKTILDYFDVDCKMFGPRKLEEIKSYIDNRLLSSG